MKKVILSLLTLVAILVLSACSSNEIKHVCKNKHETIEYEIGDFTPTLFKEDSYQKNDEELTDGVIHSTINITLNNGNHSIIHAIEVDLNKVDIMASNTNDYNAVTKTSPLYSQMLALENNKNVDVIASLNADFFGGSVPVNAFVKDGMILKAAHNDNGLYDYTNLNADIPASMPMLFGIKDNTAKIAPIITNDSVEATIKAQLSNSMIVNNKLVISNVEYNFEYFTKHMVVLDDIEKDFNINSNTILYTITTSDCECDNKHGTITKVEEVKSKKMVSPTKNTIYAYASKSAEIDKLKVNDVIELGVASDDLTWSGHSTIIGGRQSLVEQGKIASTVTLENSNGAQTTNVPRSAVGIVSNTKIVLFAVEALRYNSKNEVVEADGYGLNLPEFAEVIRMYGCYDAMNFDGGGSTQLLIDNGNTVDVIVRSSDYGTFIPAQSRSVINSIHVVKK